MPKIVIVGIVDADFYVSRFFERKQRRPALHDVVPPFSGGRDSRNGRARFGTLNANLLDILLVVSRTYR